MAVNWRSRYPHEADTEYHKSDASEYHCDSIAYHLFDLDRLLCMEHETCAARVELPYGMVAAPCSQTPPNEEDGQKSWPKPPNDQRPAQPTIIHGIDFKDIVRACSVDQ